MSFLSLLIIYTQHTLTYNLPIHNKFILIIHQSRIKANQNIHPKKTINNNIGDFEFGGRGEGETDAEGNYYYGVED